MCDVYISNCFFFIFRATLLISLGLSIMSACSTSVSNHNGGDKAGCERFLGRPVKIGTSRCGRCKQFNILVETQIGCLS